MWMASVVAVAMFKLTAAHIKLLRQAIVLWSPVESGAPGVLISPLQLADEKSPSDATYADIAKRAGLDHVDKRQIDQLLAEMPEAMAQLLAHGKMTKSVHRYDNPLVEFSFASKMLPDELAHLAADKVVTFEFTERHERLLRNARWEGMFVNPKRPYGDMTHFEKDMADILGEHTVDDACMWKLHVETLPALQAYLRDAQIEPGEYPRIEAE